MKTLRFSLRIYGLLVCVFIAACSKLDPADTPTPTSTPTSAADIPAIRQAFAAINGEAKINPVPAGQSAPVWEWHPAWDVTFQRVIGRKNYVYILLTARRHADAMPIRMVGARRYLLVEINSINKIDFSVATYISSLYGDEDDAYDSCEFFNGLSGLELIDGLTTNKNVRREYSQGLVVRKHKNNQGERIVCNDYVTCYWSAYCRTDEAHVMGTITQGIGDCYEPETNDGRCSVNLRWEVTSTTIQNYCFDDGTGNGDPSSGGDTPNDPTDPLAPKSPCETMKSLSTKAGFIAARTRLRGDVNNPPRDPQQRPLETGVTYLDPDDANTYVVTVGNEEDIRMGVASGVGIGGSMHDHPAGPGTLPIFSPGDLRGIYRYIKYLKSTGQDPVGYTATVILHTGEEYSIVIDDVDDYLAFGNRWFGDEFSDFENKYYNELKNGIGTPGFLAVDNERAFLNMMNREACGIKLMKATGSSGWSALGLSAGSVVSNACL